MSASLLTVPQELLNKILERCDYASSLALRYTCRRLYARTSTLAARKSYSMSDLLRVEKWPCYDLAGQAEGHLKQPLATRDFFACFLCLRIRCASKFSNSMMKGRRGKHSLAASIDRDERPSRFCIDCGVRYGKYLPGITFNFGGAEISIMEPELGGGHGLICYQCRQFKRIYSGTEQNERTCRACLGGSYKRAIGLGHNKGQ